MANEKFDIILLGGGLANSLAALSLKIFSPHISFVLLEKDEKLGGEHTWSFHESDLPFEQFQWLKPLVSKSWETYDVIFPKYRREVALKYHSIQSEHFHEKVYPLVKENIRLNNEVTLVKENRVFLKDGSSFEGQRVFDGRGFLPQKGANGFQKFFGLFLESEKPHGIERPILMDATCAQKEGFRFFYVLPWNAHRLLVEDTRYCIDSNISESEMESEVKEYCRRKGISFKKVIKKEIGCLPIPLEHSRFSSFPALGVRAGQFHPTTGYSLPWAVDQAWNLGHGKKIEPKFSKAGLFVWLNRVLFSIASEKRYRVLEAFYQLSEKAISNFYRGQLSLLEMANLYGKGFPFGIKELWKSCYPYKVTSFQKNHF